MAGGPEFKAGMQKASRPRGETDNYKQQGSHLIGAGAYDRQVKRESDSFDNSAVSGSRGAENIAAYANVSKQATAANGSFSVDSSNKFTNAARDQSNTNKQQEAASNFSGQRVTDNANFANSQAERAAERNEGFAMGITNDYINNAKAHREDNTAKATQFANNTVSKYMNYNKGNQANNVQALDTVVRQAPIVDKAYSDVQGNNTFGDMYAYGRGGLPTFKVPKPPSKIESPDFGGMYDKTKKDLNEIEVDD